MVPPVYHPSSRFTLRGWRVVQSGRLLPQPQIDDFLAKVRHALESAGDMPPPAQQEAATDSAS